MSFRGRARPTIRTGPSQIFKKRGDLIFTTVPSNADAFLLGSWTMAETGTIYAVTVDITAHAVASAATDMQRVIIWVRCVPANTPLPDLTLNAEMDTLNGFSAGVFVTEGTTELSPSQTIRQKFRFRRKCDDGMDVQLIAQHTNVQGVGRSVLIVGRFGGVVRVR